MGVYEKKSFRKKILHQYKLSFYYELNCLLMPLIKIALKC